MSLTKQILLAFSIPFILAVGLAFLGDYFFFPGCVSTFVIYGEMFCSSYSDRTSFYALFYVILVIGLFLASLILPPFLSRRVYQSRRNKLESGSIIK